MDKTNSIKENDIDNDLIQSAKKIYDSNKFKMAYKDFLRTLYEYISVKNLKIQTFDSFETIPNINEFCCVGTIDPWEPKFLDELRMVLSCVKEFGKPFYEKIIENHLPSEKIKLESNSSNWMCESISKIFSENESKEASKSKKKGIIVTVDNRQFCYSCFNQKNSESADCPKLKFKISIKNSISADKFFRFFYRRKP